jgi:hypothetical protein
MPGHHRVGRRTSVLAVTFAIGACGLAISAWALEPAQEGSAVSYSTNQWNAARTKSRGPWLKRVSLRMHFPEDYRHFDLDFRVVR